MKELMPLFTIQADLHMAHWAVTLPCMPRRSVSPLYTRMARSMILIDLYKGTHSYSQAWASPYSPLATCYAKAATRPVVCINRHLCPLAVRIDVSRYMICATSVSTSWYLVCSINLISVSCGHAHVMTVSRLRPSHAW